MDENTDVNPAQEQPEQPQADASIDLRMDKGELRINIAGPDDHLSNEAVHFAHWVGHNLATLTALAREDRNLRLELVQQGKAIAQLAAPQEGRPVIELPVRALRGPDGQKLQ